MGRMPGSGGSFSSSAPRKKSFFSLPGSLPVRLARSMRHRLATAGSLAPDRPRTCRGEPEKRQTVAGF